MSVYATGSLAVGQVLTGAANRYPDDLGYICTSTGRRHTFRETNTRCNRLANGLLSLGLKKGERVAFLSSNRVEMVEIYFAIAKAGFIGMPLNYRLAPGEMVELMRSVECGALLVERRFVPALAPRLEAVPTLRHRVSFGDGNEFGQDYEALLAGASAAEPQVEVDEGDGFYFNLTSGTTGLPKCYLIRHYNCTAGSNMFQSLEVTRRDVAMTVFPMFGRVGFGWAYNSAFYGIPNVLVNFEADSALRLIGEEGVTIMNLVPTMAAMLLASPELGRHSLASLRHVIFAGAALPEPLRRAVQESVCANVNEYYGMQETGMLVFSTPEDRVRKPGSVGRQAYFAQVRIVDASGREMPPGEPGEILGRCPAAVTGYYDNPAKSAETFRDGWVHTGDIGYFDEDGYLFISGRLKEVIVTGGQNVHAAEVEEMILNFPGIAEVAVIGLPDPLWGESVTAVVVPAEGMKIDGDALIRFCHERLAGFKTPKRVLQVGDALPRTPTGKVQKFKLVERYAEAGK